MESKKITGMLLTGVFCTAIATSGHAATVLFQEDFNGITSGYYFDNCGGACSHYIQTGVPMATGSGTTINGGADNDWYAARFQVPLVDPPCRMSVSSKSVVPQGPVHRMSTTRRLWECFKTMPA